MRIRFQGALIVFLSPPPPPSLTKKKSEKKIGQKRQTIHGKAAKTEIQAFK